MVIKVMDFDFYCVINFLIFEIFINILKGYKIIGVKFLKCLEKM